MAPFGQVPPSRARARARVDGGARSGSTKPEFHRLEGIALIGLNRLEVGQIALEIPMDEARERLGCGHQRPPSKSTLTGHDQGGIFSMLLSMDPRCALSRLGAVNNEGDPTASSNPDGSDPLVHGGTLNLTFELPSQDLVCKNSRIRKPLCTLRAATSAVKLSAARAERSSGPAPSRSCRATSCARARSRGARPFRRGVRFGGARPGVGRWTRQGAGERERMNAASSPEMTPLSRQR
jgi:hypothetical protein